MLYLTSYLNRITFLHMTTNTSSLKFTKERINDFDARYFVNEIATASKYLGILEAKIDSYQFNSILIPMLQKKEAISSMYIEGTQTTIPDVLKSEINPKPGNKKNPVRSSKSYKNFDFRHRISSIRKVYSFFLETTAYLHDDRHHCS